MAERPLIVIVIVR